jgi:hypothetical protein
LAGEENAGLIESRKGKSVSNILNAAVKGDIKVPVWSET